MGVAVNTNNIIFTLHGIDAAGSMTNIYSWTHGGGDQHNTALLELSHTAYHDKHLYISGNLAEYDASGLTVSFIFTNSDCLGDR